MKWVDYFLGWGEGTMLLLWHYLKQQHKKEQQVNNPKEVNVFVVAVVIVVYWYIVIVYLFITINLFIAKYNGVQICFVQSVLSVPKIWTFQPLIRSERVVKKCTLICVFSKGYKCKIESQKNRWENCLLVKIMLCKNWHWTQLNLSRKKPVDNMVQQFRRSKIIF